MNPRSETYVVHGNKIFTIIYIQHNHKSYKKFGRINMNEIII